MHFIEKEPVRLKKNEAVLVVVDIQERLIPAMREGEKVISQSAKIIRGFRALDIPIIVTQQYTKGLGETVEAVRDAFDGDFSYIEKSAFSVMGEPSFKETLSKSYRKTVVLLGVEAHVCVLQSALDMIADGYKVFLVTDAISSRKEMDEVPGVRRIEYSGAVPTTVESALFELLDNDSKSDTFKTISKLIK